MQTPRPVLVAGLLLLTTAPAAAQDATSLHLGRILVVDFSARLQLDWRASPAGTAAARDGVFDIHRARVGIEGTILRRVEYQVERKPPRLRQPMA